MVENNNCMDYTGSYIDVSEIMNFINNEVERPTSKSLFMLFIDDMKKNGKTVEKNPRSRANILEIKDVAYLYFTSATRQMWWGFSGKVIKEIKKEEKEPMNHFFLVFFDGTEYGIIDANKIEINENQRIHVNKLKGKYQPSIVPVNKDAPKKIEVKIAKEISDLIKIIEGENRNATGK